MDKHEDSLSSAESQDLSVRSGFGVDRRRLLAGGAVAGMTVLVLPSAAVAASGDAEPSEPLSSDGSASEGASVLGEDESFTAPQPTPQPPVVSATTTLTADSATSA